MIRTLEDAARYYIREKTRLDGEYAKSPAWKDLNDFLTDGFKAFIAKRVLEIAKEMDQEEATRE
jgi:hypothetical protein